MNTKCFIFAAENANSMEFAKPFCRLLYRITLVAILGFGSASVLAQSDVAERQENRPGRPRLDLAGYDFVLTERLDQRGESVSLILTRLYASDVPREERRPVGKFDLVSRNDKSGEAVISLKGEEGVHSARLHSYKVKKATLQKQNEVLAKTKQKLGLANKSPKARPVAQERHARNNEAINRMKQLRAEKRR